MLVAEDASELLRRMEAGELSSVELVRALRERSDEVDGAVGAIVHRMSDAEAEAERLDAERARGALRGPLHGLPVTIKDNVDVAGTDSTVGLAARVGRPAAVDSVVVSELKRAGALVLAKTNVPQSLLSFETENRIWGTTNNPWNPTRVPGGSSGGEAAALASGQSVLGIGTDIGGSIRTPAAFCGVVGIKPTEHRWSNLGSSSAIVGQEAIRAQIGPLARSVRDLRLVVSALEPAAMAARDPFVPPVPLGDAAPPSELRVGVYDADGFFEPSSAVRRAVARAKQHLQDAGVEVVDFRPPNVERLAYLYFAILAADDGDTLKRALEGEEPVPQMKTLLGLTRVPPKARQLLARALAVAGERRVAGMMRAMGPKSVADYWQLTGERAKLRVQELEAWRRAGVHAVLCPAFPTVAPQHRSTHDFALGAVYAMRYNILNLPAGVVPVTSARDDDALRPEGGDRLDAKARSIEAGSTGLPVAVQIVGRPYRELDVLALLEQVERAARESGEQPRVPVDPRSRRVGPLA